MKLIEFEIAKEATMQVWNINPNNLFSFDESMYFLRRVLCKRLGYWNHWWMTKPNSQETICMTKWSFEINFRIYKFKGYWNMQFNDT